MDKKNDPNKKDDKYPNREEIKGLEESKRKKGQTFTFATVTEPISTENANVF